ncbi:ComF family protein [Chloroflexota bacterium]
MLPLLTRLGGTALGLLFPCWCLGCGREGSLICADCRLKLPEIKPPLCPRCGMPQPGGILCAGCLNHKPKIDGIRSVFRFEGIMRQAIHRFKYNNLRAIAKPLARLLGDYLATYPLTAEVIVPVPLHRRRLRERGYNQSELLAKELGKITGLPLIKGGLFRQQLSQPQARAASAVERRKNVAGAFICRGDNLKDKSILLIDDVATSGATLDACAAALKAAGGGKVWGLTLAREV